MDGYSISGANHPKKVNRCRSFHFRYLELCRAKNYPPLLDIKAKNNVTSNLDFFGDKLKSDDWLLIIESLHYDQILQNLAIRMRKIYGNVAEQIDTEKRAKLFKHKPTVYTKFVFGGVVEAISNCIKFNKNLSTLCLEALPLNEKYVVSIAKALSTNEHLKCVSFQRSPIGDKGIETICSTIKSMANIENLNMSECNITAEGATYIADMIKFQKIFRYSEGWKKSLRYREVDPDTIPGLRAIHLSHNPGIGDQGVKMIAEILKEDVWIKIISMDDCGLTDVGANSIIDCLEINKQIAEFNVRGNPEVSKFLLRNLRLQLGKEDDQMRDDENNTKKSKVSMAQIRERVKFLEEQIAFEKNLRKQEELLNEQLHAQIMAYERQLSEQGGESPTTSEESLQIPEGCTLIKDESLKKLIKERDEYKEIIATLKAPQPAPSVRNTSRRSTKVRKVKSETKYVEKTSSRRKVTRSDHHFNEAKMIEPKDAQTSRSKIFVETNIGDTGNICQITSRVEKPKQKVQNNFFLKSPKKSARNESSHSTATLTYSDDDNFDTWSDDAYFTKPQTFRGIGGCPAPTLGPRNYSNEDYDDTWSNTKPQAFKGIEEAFRIFVRKKQPMQTERSTGKRYEDSSNTSPRSLFIGSKKH